MDPRDQKLFIPQVIHRVVERSPAQPALLEQVVFDTLYEERQRLEPILHQPEARKEWAFYKRIQKRALHADAQGLRQILIQLVSHFSQEILGNFSPAIYQISTKVLPLSLNFLFNSLSPLKLFRSIFQGFSQWKDPLKILGETEAMRRVAGLGTVILVPTHVSNLDSPLVGYMLYRLGLPPFLYGAGLNLFSNKLLGYFMDHLGAYKVDRRKKAKLYKQVLKVYAGYSMEMGCHNLFFPGGTRSRSGAVEGKLKLGLLGMGLDAYIHNLLAAKPKPDIFVIPCTLNYPLVLEAETLIEDYLKEQGKARYIIEDDESSQIKRIAAFVGHLFDLESRVQVYVGTPRDVFGNPVDSHGRSLDPRGRVLRRETYVFHKGKPVFDEQRDQEYTQELSQAICGAFRRDTILSSVHLLCCVVFRWLEELNPGMDRYRLLRTGGREASMEMGELYSRLQKFLGILKKQMRRHAIRLDSVLMGRDPLMIVADALAHLKEYHTHKVLERRGDRLYHFDRSLLLYYQNRVPPLEGL